MELPPDVDIWWAEHNEAEAAALVSELPVAERDRYHGISHPRTRRHFLLGRIALRSLLSRRLGIPFTEVPLVPASDGGVDVKGGWLQVSLAHAGDRAVAVAAVRPVGIDLERIQSRSARVVDFMLHPLERDCYEALPLDGDRKLILYWTLKEAVLKALRTGLRRSPKSVRLSVSVPRGAGIAYLDDCASLELRFQEEDEYYVSVAFGR